MNWLKVQEWKRPEVPAGVYISPKIDGWRVRIRIQNGQWKVFTRKQEITSYLEGIETHLPVLSARNDLWVYEAEMYVPGRNASEVVTVYKNRPHELRFYLLAVLQHNAEDLRGELPESLDSLREKFFPVLSLPDLRSDRMGFEMSTETLRAIAKGKNLEGWVLRGRMYKDWFKIKVTRTADVFVTGFKDGNGKFEGDVGALKVSVFLRDGTKMEIGNVSGMTDKERGDIHELNDLGRVCEIKYDRVDKRRLRHPRFLRWRDDKSPKDCTWEQFT